MVDKSIPSQASLTFVIFGQVGYSSTIIKSHSVSFSSDRHYNLPSLRNSFLAERAKESSAEALHCYIAANHVVTSSVEDGESPMTLEAITEHFDKTIERLDSVLREHHLMRKPLLFTKSVRSEYEKSVQAWFTAAEEWKAAIEIYHELEADDIQLVIVQTPSEALTKLRFAKSLVNKEGLDNRPNTGIPRGMNPYV